MERIAAPAFVTDAAAVALAQALVKDDGLYLISRNGGWFRPMAQGYTMNVADAGIYPGREAKQYLDVGGIVLVPIAEMRHRLDMEVRELQEKMDAARAKIALLGKGEAGEKASTQDHQVA